MSISVKPTEYSLTFKLESSCIAIELLVNQYVLIDLKLLAVMFACYVIIPHHYIMGLYAPASRSWTTV